MGLFSRKKEKVNVNKPVENLNLKKSFQLFNLNKCDETLMTVINELKKASFLVIAITDEMKILQDSNTIIEKGSIIKFINCYDNNKIPFLPLFTDWQEVDLWLKQRDNNVGGFIMSTFEGFEFVANNQSYYGVVINPGSVGWTMKKEQIINFLSDFK